MKKLIGNTSWLLLNQIFQMVISFFVGILSTRYLGPSNYGSITYISTYVSFFSSLCTMGMDTVVISKLVNYKDRDGEIIITATCIRAVSAIISIFSLSMVVYIVDGNDISLQIIALILGFKLVLNAFTTVGYWYQYKLLSKKMVIVDMFTFVLGNAFRIWMLATEKNVYWFASYATVLVLLNVIVDVPLFLKDCKTRKFLSKEMVKELLKDCLPYMISGVMVSLYSQVDIIMIKHMMNGTNYVGYYSAAYTICNLIAFIPQAISQSARPVLMELKKENNHSYNTRVTQTLAIIIWFAIIYSIFITLFSNIVIGILYGESFAPSSGVLKVLVWSTLFENLTRIRDMWFIGENESKFVAILSFLGTITNVIANALLIPLLGIYGAAIATIGTQLVVTVILPAMRKETRQYAIDVLNALFLRNVDIFNFVKEIANSFKLKKVEENV